MPKFDPATFRIDTFGLTANTRDANEFTAQTVRLAEQLAQIDRKASSTAMDSASRAFQRRIDPHSQSLPPDNDGFLFPHQYAYSSVWNSYKQFYYYYFDEALRDSYQNALAMRRDGIIHELLRHRQLPTVSLDYHLVPDDPDDKGQLDVVKQVTKVIDRTRKYQSMKLWLLESIYFGKSGTQLRWGKKKIDGIERIYIRDFMPIQGDKIVYKWDGTPGILVWTGSTFTQQPNVKPYIDINTIAPAFYLYPQEYKDKFIIMGFEPSDFDYLFEGEKAMAVHGIGLRDRLYWTWNMRTELLSWQLDALQRVGANGMLYAFFQSGNPQSMMETINALKMLVKENVAAFPVLPGTDANAQIKNIPPAPVGYDVLFQLMTYLDDIMRRTVLGQELTSVSKPQGIGGGASNIQAETFQNIIKYDANGLAEALDEQQLDPTVRFNIWEYKGKKYRGDQLPFGMRYEIQAEEENVGELIEAASKLHEMGVALDMEDLRDKAGFQPPKNTTTSTLMPGMSPPSSAAPGTNGSATHGVNGAANGTTNGQPHPPVGGNARRNGPEQFAGKDRWSVVEGPLVPGCEADEWVGPDDAPESLPEHYGKDRSDDPGVMIALKVPRDVAESIALPGGEDPDDFHVTLAYLGRLSTLDSEALGEAKAVIEQIADAYPPLMGVLKGMGRFPASDSSDGMDVLHAHVDVPGLAEFRDELVTMLRIGAIPFSEKFAYNPHVTLRYVKPSTKSPGPIEATPVEFDSLSLHVGGRSYEFPFKNQIEAMVGV